MNVIKCLNMRRLSINKMVSSLISYVENCVDETWNSNNEDTRMDTRLSILVAVVFVIILLTSYLFT